MSNFEGSIESWFSGNFQALIPSLPVLTPTPVELNANINWFPFACSEFRVIELEKRKNVKHTSTHETNHIQI